MNWLFILVALALVSQIGLFFYSRKLKKRLKNNAIERYGLKTPKDAWEALGNPDIPDRDKEEIRKYYHGEE